MRALILCLVVVTAALPAGAQTPAPSKAALALAARAPYAAQPRLDDSVGVMVQSLATSYRNGATRGDAAVNEAVLADVTKSETEAFRPLLWDGLARVYADLFTQDELKAMIAYFKDHPGDTQNLPPALAAKSDALQTRQRELVAQLGPRALQDFFGEYCSRASCSDITRQAAGLKPRAVPAAQ